ncbi:MAG: hypothetical protein E6Q98_24665 [Rhodospirillaceae bacterium]|nr:MAG: hypothetical protein E6Q98_24665 [Rhodospirillaceae bacterium]
MATLEQLRLAIGQRMATVPDLGVIHPYERYAAAEAAFRDLYVWGNGKKEVRGWFIRRTAYRETSYLSSRTMLEIDWQIRGYMSLQDAAMSEVVMDGLVEQLRAAFKRDLTLGGLVVDRRESGQPIGLQLAESAPYMFAGILCHGIALNLTTIGYDDAIPDAGDPGLGDFKIFHANWDIPVFGNVLPPLPADDTADATDHVIMETD